VRLHPFRFAPFAALTEQDVREVLASAGPRIAAYREEMRAERRRPSRVSRLLPEGWGLLQPA
jgi:hypothetical protein